MFDRQQHNLLNLNAAVPPLRPGATVSDVYDALRNVVEQVNHNFHQQGRVLTQCGPLEHDLDGQTFDLYNGPGEDAERPALSITTLGGPALTVTGGDSTFETVKTTNVQILGSGGSYIDLLPAGVIVFWDPEETVPSGWAVCDGSANSVGNGGTGIDLLSVVDGVQPFLRMGLARNSGGVTDHEHALPNHVHSNTHGHTASGSTTGSATTGIEVAPHDGTTPESYMIHSHSVVPTLASATIDFGGVAAVYPGGEGALLAVAIDDDFDNGDSWTHSVTDTGHTHSLSSITIDNYTGNTGNPTTSPDGETVEHIPPYRQAVPIQKLAV